MGKLGKYFAAVSVGMLIVLAVSPMKDFFREWKGYQYEFNRLITTLPQRVKPTEIGIKQIWVQKLNRVDRCETCHLGVNTPALKDAKEPFTTHPHIYHDIEGFGCTMCHGGQGVATEYKESTGRVKYWDQPMLTSDFIEASCGKCHKENPVPEAPVLNEGRKLIQESNCVACHRIEGYTKQWAPSLNGIGSKVNRAWLVRWLKNPKQYFPDTRMPNFMLNDSDASDLADFLMTFTSRKIGVQFDALPVSLTGATEDQMGQRIDNGSTIFREARCISCHKINGRGGYVATELGKVASKVNEQWLYNYIKNPKKIMPGVPMPQFRFTRSQLASVVAYMESEFLDYDNDTTSDVQHTPDPAFYENGLALFKKYNCAGCHQLQGVKGSSDIGPELTYVGSKPLYEIDFGTTTIERTLPSYIKTKLLHPRIYTPAMKMPNFGFTDEQATAIAVALLSNTSESIPEDYMVRPQPKRNFIPQGKFGKIVRELSCQSCHTMEGTGRLIATDLSMEASQAQKHWIKSYFKVPYSLRPILTERMPNFFLPDSEINTIVNYFETVFVIDSISRPFKHNNALIAEGRGLYYEKYGCQSCHIIGGKGGYVGPTLDKVGARLKAGWIYHWLKKPEAYRPNTIEPDNKLTDYEADALTEFLMTLK